jgi:membrane-associated protease RseP (regulator of RpoE activity)
MIGITMSNESGGGVRIDSVLDSLPAAKAGLRAGEVIWSIDGDTIDNEAELRELLRGKEPGDKLKVKVKQEDGEFREVILKLEAFDPDRMAVRTRTLEGSAFGPDPLLDSHERIMENLRRSLEQVEGIKESDMARIQEEVRRAFDMRSRYGDVVAIAPRAGGLARVPRAGGGGGTPPLTFAPMSNVQNEEVIKKLESVLKKLERVEKRLEEIEKKLGAGNQRQ